MKRCSVCHRFFVGGYRQNSEAFCSLDCFTYSPSRAFCSRCVEVTTVESPGNTHTVNMIVGTRLVGAAQRCPVCHSVIQQKVMLPFCLTIESYRVIYLGGGGYMGRKVRLQEDPPDDFIIQSQLDEFPSEELYDKARLLEQGGQFEEALEVFECVAKLYPHTAAGDDARMCIARVRSKV